MNLETKFTRATGTLDPPNLLHGYAARFDEESAILFDKAVCKGPFIEVIKPGAFSRTLREDPDILALFNHDRGCVLGRTKAGTLRLRETDEGLAFEDDLPDTTFARDLRESLRRGDYDGCSFYGYVVDDQVQLRPGQPALRTIFDIELIEVTPATALPAYKSTSVALRSRHVEIPEPPPLGARLRLLQARLRLSRA